MLFKLRLLWSSAAWVILLFPRRAFTSPLLTEPTKVTDDLQIPIRDPMLPWSLVDDSSIPVDKAPPSCINQTVCDNDLSGTQHQRLPPTLFLLLDALRVMQSEYFELWAGTWPSSIDWTAAVLGTHVSATLTTFVSTLDYANKQCTNLIEWENNINRYFNHLTAFYFGENSFSLRNEAYDDMLWVVLGWLENVKFSTYYSQTYWQSSTEWYGTQLKGPAAHRARVFYDIAARGYDTSLCGGGMVWNPELEPYKNAITNELFVSASIAMYLYFPGDDNDSPFMAEERPPKHRPHEKKYLHSAVETYKWLKSSNMTNSNGLYMDGYHITGWHRRQNGTVSPGTGKCDDLDPMIYTYNQGVILSGLKGLWIATNSEKYLDDGHELVQNVIEATGWPHHSKQWAGLGRAGVLEEFCDSRGDCSQNGHTFKGIFFHHLVEFCRPLWSYEEDFMREKEGLDMLAYRYHQLHCLSYTAWVKHNAQAALVTRNGQGMYGTWWGRPFHPHPEDIDIEPATLPDGAIDYRNAGIPKGAPWNELNDIPEKEQRPVESSEDLEQDAAERGRDVNDRGRGRTVETQSGGVAVLRALWTWQALVSTPTASEEYP